MTKARILADYVAGGTTAAEFDYMDGVTSNVQTQLDAKAPLASPTFTGNFTSVGIDDNADANAITIDANENVGIGVTNPSDFNDSINNLVVGSIASGSHGITIATHSTSTGYLSFADGATTAADEYRGLIEYDHSANKMHLRTDAAQRLTIDSDGRVGIGIDSPTGHLHVRATGTGDIATVEVDGDSGSGDGGGQVRLKYNGTTYGHFRIRNDTGQGNAFSIQIGDTNLSHGVYMNQDTSGWTNFSSDERRKTDWTMFENAVDKINTLTKIGIYYDMNPVTEEKTNSDLPQVGISAQEVKAILPEAVDESVFEHLKTDDNEEGKYLSMRYSDVFCLGLKAIQELSAKNDALEAKVTALENA